MDRPTVKGRDGEHTNCDRLQFKNSDGYIDRTGPPLSKMNAIHSYVCNDI